MANRIAGILALIAFAIALLVGVFEADNGFSTVIYRGLLAMLGTYVIGYFVGIAAERMLSENVAAETKRLEAAEKLAAATEDPATDGR